MGVRVGILWRAEWDPVAAEASITEACRLHGMFAAFSALGVAAEPVVYSDGAVDGIRAQLLDLDGVLVWVNPIEQGLDRSHLDPLLREVAAAGVWVSAHPDVITRLATKQVLVDTAGMSWSAEAHLYRTRDQLRAELPDRVAARGPLVLKQQRGMGGAGVWKVELEDGSLRVQHAAKGSLSERVPVNEFLDRCAPYFSGGGLMVEQPFQSRLCEGMIRVYLATTRWWDSRTSTRPGSSPLRTQRRRRRRRCSSSRRLCAMGTSASRWNPNGCPSCAGSWGSTGTRSR